MGRSDFKEPKRFAHHIKKEHNRWSYFKYMLYLDEKDEDTYTGLEQYVWDLINSKNARDQIRWFPSGKALSLSAREADENNGDEDEEEDEDDDGVEDDDKDA